MKILQINKFNKIKGGADKYYLELTELLKKNNHQVVNFSSAALRPNDFSHVKFSPTSALKFIYNFKAKKKLTKLIKQEKPDIAHLHNIHHYLTPSILLVLKKHKIPIVQTIHDWQVVCPNYRLQNGQGQICEKCKPKKYWHCIINKCVKNSYLASILNFFEMAFWNIIKNYDSYIDIYIAPSRFAKNKLINWGLAEQKIKVLKHFLVSSPKEGEQALAHLQVGDRGSRPGENYFLYAGRLVKEKGILTLLKTFAKLKNQKLYLAGCGMAVPEIKNIISQKKLTNIKLTGHKQPCQLKKLITNAKACIIPSNWYETFGYAVAESQILGAPVIVSNIGALPELIQHKKTGLLFKPADVTNLITQINWLLKNPKPVQKIITQAKTQTKSELDPQKHYLTLMKIYSLIA